MPTLIFGGYSMILVTGLIMYEIWMKVLTLRLRQDVYFRSRVY